MKSLATLLVSGAGLFAMVNSSSPWVVIQKDQLTQLQALANQNVNNAFTEGASAAADSSALVDPSTPKASAIQLAVTSSQPAAPTASQPGSNSSASWMSQDSSNPLNQPASGYTPAVSSPPVIYTNDGTVYDYHHYHYWNYWHREHSERPRTNSVMMSTAKHKGSSN